MRIKKLRWIGLFTLSILFILSTLESCNEYTTLGDNLTSGLNPNEVKQADTFQLKTSMIKVNWDSVYSTRMTNAALGSMDGDPIFGQMIAAVYAQYGLPQDNFGFKGPSPVLDSIILSLRYSGYYGDSTSTQTYTAYRIIDPSFSDTTLQYYNHQKFNIDKGNPLGSITVAAQDIKDSLQVVNSFQPAQLRLKLDPAFGNDLLSQSSSDALANDSAFHQWLNGIALLPDSSAAGRESMIYFELNDQFTGISVFYHNSKEDSLFTYFPFNPTSGAWSNYQNHDYAGTPVEQSLQSTHTTDSILYLQSNTGLFADIELPDMDELEDAVINTATLTITQIDDPSNEILTPPYELFLWQYQNAAMDSVEYIVDVGAIYNPYNGWQFSNLDYFGGLIHNTTNKEGIKVAQYRFKITRYIQHLVNGKPDVKGNYGLRLGVLDPLNRGPNIGRVMLGGGNHSKYRMKLNIVYTKIK